MQRLVPCDATPSQRRQAIVTRLLREHFVGVQGCWIWTGNTNRNSYGCLKFEDVTYRVHRLAWECLVGPIPAGLDIDHLCHNVDKTCPGGSWCLHRRCFNPSHLLPRTRQANTAAGRSGDERATQCPQGHSYAQPANVGRDPRGKRYCKQCRRERALAYYYAHKA